MDTIIINNEVYPIDLSTAAIAAEAKNRALHSFNLTTNDDGSDWQLTVNKHVLLGRYPSQATALGALFGYLIHAGADKTGAEATLSKLVVAGSGVIAEDGDNIITHRVENGYHVGQIRNFNEQTFVPTSTAVAAANSVNLNGDITDLGVLTTLTVDGLATYNATYNFSVSTTWTNPATLNTIALSQISIGGLSVNVSFPTNAPVVGQPYTATAELTNYDPRIPVKYRWTWFKVVSGTATAVQGPTTTSSPTNSYTPLLGNTAYRAKVEMLYATNDALIAGVDDQEGSSLSLVPFTWIQGPEVTYLSQDQYNISPVLNTDYQSKVVGVGTGATFAYEWTKDGLTFGNDAATQVLSTPGIYQADVTGQNIINGITYSATKNTRNSITILPAGTLVADIKLFLTADPNGTEQTVIQPTTEYFAYPYDTNGTLITDTNIDWVFPGQPTNVVVSVSGTEKTGQTLTSTAATADGIGPITFTYQWSVGGVDEVGETGLTFVLPATAAGQTVRMTATASSALTTIGVEGFDDTGVIVAATIPSNVVVTGTGDEYVTGVLDAGTPTYAGDEPITLSYSWDGVGPTTDAATYTLVAGDEGNIVTVTVTATNVTGAATGTWATGTIAAEPTNDWDTFQVGAGKITGRTTSNNVIAYDASYPAGPTPSYHFNTDSGGGFTGQTPRSHYTGGTVNRDAIAAAQPYFAMYVTATEAADGGGGFMSQQGWYVYKVADVNGGTDPNYCQWRIPWAWPTGAVPADGSFTVLNTPPTPINGVAALSNCTLAAGAGGTDSWSDPSAALGL